MKYVKTLEVLSDLGVTAQDVRDVLECYADEIEALEPYATNTIHEVRQAARQIAHVEDSE